MMPLHRIYAPVSTHAWPTAAHAAPSAQLDTDNNQKVSDDELQGIRTLDPGPAMSKEQFVQRFRRGEHADTPMEVLMKAFDHMDKNSDG